tara:strand:- start:202 stop:1392 length:1191 start_codon:yes stop_codon:yes gene_type:complete
MLVDSKLLATIIAVAKKEARVLSRDTLALEVKVEKQLKEFHSRSPILETPDFYIKAGELFCKWNSGLTLSFGSVVGPKGDKGDKGDRGDKGDKGAGVDYAKIKTLIPEAIPGKDAVVDYNKIKRMIPEATPGKDAVVDYDKIKRMIPEATPGKDAVVDYDKIKRMIPEAIPGTDGEDGKDAVIDYDKIKRMIPEAIPGTDGEDGKDAVIDYDKIKRMIPEAIPGTDGEDGIDGVGVDKVYLSDNYHLTIKLTSGKVIDVGNVRGAAGVAASKGGRVTGGYSGGGSGSSVSVVGAEYDSDGTLIISLSNGSTVRANSPETFETYNRNLKAYNFVANRTGDDITSLVYTKGTSVITKTFTRANGLLVSITLSGDIPAGIATTKTIVRTSNDKTDFVYS